MRNNFFAVGTKTENAVDVVESWHPDVGKKSAANNTALSRYGFAIMATAMAIALRMALSPVIGNERIPFITMFAAVLLVGWYSGLGPALFSLVLGGFAATFFFMAPAAQFAISSWQDAASLAVYLIAGGACAFIGHNINRARERAEENERAARAGEAAIRERDLDLKLMADAMPQVAWIADNEGKISYYNHRAVNFGGIELNGGVYDWHPGVHKDDLESTLHAWQDAVRENRVYEHKHRILMADGGYRWHLSRAVPVADADGKTRRWYGTATDIHDLKTEEDDREFLLSVAEKIRVGRGAGELLSEISSALGRYLDIHRCLFNEIDVETDTAIVHSDYCRAGKSVAGRHKLSDYSELAGQSLIAGQTVVNRDTKSDPRTADYFEKSYGPANELSYVAVPMLRNGKWVATLWCSDDRPRNWTDRETALLENVAERAWAAVERLRAEDVLRRNEEMFSTMVETAPFGVYFIDSGFRLMSVNSGAQKVFSGIQPLIGRDFAEILRIVWPEPFATEAIEKFRRTLRTGEAYISPTITEDRANVDVTESYDWQIHRITLPDGSYGVVCYFYDLTHQKRLEAAVRRSAEIDAFRVRLADALRPISDPAEIQSTTGRVLGEYLNVNRVAYFEVKGGDYVVERDYVSGVPHIAGRHPIDSFGEKLLSAYRTGNAVCSNDTNADPGLSAEERAAYAAIQIGSYIGVPLIKDGRFVAGLAVHCLKPHSWTNDEITTVRETAERTWAAVERARAEEALRESEERFSKAFKASPLVVTISSLATGKLVEVNDTFTAVTGYLRSEAVGKTTAELGLWAKTIDREREMEIVRKTGQISGAEYVFRTRDGREITGLLSAERIEIGSEPCALTVIQDITERKIAAEKIRKSELQLRLVTDSLPALISYVDQKERYQFVNKAYTDWFDQPPEYFIGKTIKQVIGSKGYQSVSPLIKRTLAGETLSIQTEVAYQKAGERFVHIYYVPDFANDGTVRGYFAMISDLTEIKRAEELLKSSEARIALLMENVTDYAIFSTDSEGVVESWNTGAEKIFGYSAEEIIGKPSEMLFTAEDVDKGVHTNEMRAARQKGRAADERWYIRKDGSRFFGSGVMMPLFVGKHLTGYAKIASDLTERKRRAEELQRAHDELEFRVFQRTRELGETNDLLRQEIEHRKASEKQRVQLLHRIVSAQESERKRIARDIHDQFGQRLTALRLKLASLRDLCAENEGVTKRVERLQEIASLLDSEVSFLASELRPTVLDDLGLEEALRAYAGEWSNHFDINLDFHSNGLIGKRYVREAETQFYRIAQEALNNVAKHSGATEVTMLMEQTAEALVLVIEDNGSGFEIGKQSPKHNKGLGLVGMRERAALIGAELELESTSGQGTTIYLRLPNRKRGKSNGRET